MRPYRTLESFAITFFIIFVSFFWLVPDGSADAGNLVQPLPLRTLAALFMEPVMEPVPNAQARHWACVVMSAAAAPAETKPFHFYSSDGVHHVLNWKLSPNQHILAKWTQGRLSLHTPCAGTSTVIFVESPVLMSGFDWRPAALTRKGHTLTLTINYFSDTFPRAMTGTIRLAYCMDIGTLQSGNYHLQLCVHHLLAVSQYLYHIVSVRQTSLVFSVARRVSDRSAPGLVVKTQAVKIARIPKRLRHRLWQMAYYRAKSRIYETRHAFAYKRGLQVGRNNSRKINWAQIAPLILKAPRLGRPSIHGHNYAIVIPPEKLYAGDWMSLENVRWRGNAVTIHVSVWENNKPQKTLVKGFYPVTLLRLAMPGVYNRWGFLIAHGNYTVRVRYRVYELSAGQDVNPTAILIPTPSIYYQFPHKTSFVIR